MIALSKNEQQFTQKMTALKKASGTHSPSINTLLKELGDFKVKIDACFLSNPYATELFLTRLKEDLVETDRLRPYLEFYPSQNARVAESIAAVTEVDPKRIFVGNGAIEIIQAVVQRYCGRKFVVNIPTFSSYYEFKLPGQEVVFYQLNKTEDFAIDAGKYGSFVEAEKSDAVVIINPNNPDGGYLNKSEIENLLERFARLETVIIDESFIHFAYEDGDMTIPSVAELIDRYPNLIIIKSMSKDFGIAGIRAGYAIMSEERVRSLLGNGFLWNSNGLSEYFFELYATSAFQKDYEATRLRYLEEMQDFQKSIAAIGGLKDYPSKGNFVLGEIDDGGSSAQDVSTALLCRYGIYVRNCADKIGLDGEFLRIAARTKLENDRILEALSALLGEAV